MMTKLSLGPMFLDENNQVFYGYDSALERVNNGIQVWLVGSLTKMSAERIEIEYMSEQLQDAERDFE